MFYELSIKTTVQDKNGNDKEVKEKYITDCLLFAEAECKGMEHSGNADVTDIKRSNVTEIINSKGEEETFYKAKVVSIFIDENGNEKETSYYLLVAAKDVKQATDRTLDHLKQGMDDLRLDGISKTKILEVL